MTKGGVLDFSEVGVVGHLSYEGQGKKHSSWSDHMHEPAHIWLSNNQKKDRWQMQH